MRNLKMNSVKRVLVMFMFACAFVAAGAQTTKDNNKKWDFSVSGYYDASAICSAKIMEDVAIGYNVGKMTTVSLDAFMTFSDKDNDTWGLFANVSAHPKLANKLELVPFVGVGALSGELNGVDCDARLAAQAGANLRYYVKSNFYCAAGVKGIFSGAHKSGAFAGVSLGYAF
jgi:hypothetical protein